MRPRILLRTHYQADEPRTVIAAVTKCSSPTRSRHEETIAAALVKWAQDNEYTLSTPGAVYAVGNARSLTLLNSSYRWTSKGLALGFIDTILPPAKGVTGLVLSGPEQRLYLKYYLESAGALLIKFGTWLLKRGGTTDDELRTNSTIENMVVEALDEYLKIASDIRDRTAIRKERERLNRSEYAPATKRHKRYPLIRTLERLNLLFTEQEDGHRTSISPDPKGHLGSLLKQIPDVAALERLCRNRGLEDAIDMSEYQGNEGRIPSHSDGSRLLASAYGFAIDCGLQACPLTYLDDLLFACLRVDGPRPLAEDIFEHLHKRYPAEIRFHVDRQGRRAFVLVSGNAAIGLQDLLATKS